MPDIPKSLDDLLTNVFQDGQPDGSITPQDVRDLIVSIADAPYGSIHIEPGAAETNISNVGEYIKAAGASVLIQSNRMDMPANNRLRYTGAIPYHFRIAASSSAFAASNNKLFAFQFFIFDDSLGIGELAIPSQVNSKFGSSGDQSASSVHFDAVLDTNDYVEFHVANLTDSTNITLEHMYLSMAGRLV